MINLNDGATPPSPNEQNTTPQHCPGDGTTTYPDHRWTWAPPSLRKTDMTQQCQRCGGLREAVRFQGQ